METKKLCAAPQPIPAFEAMQASGVMAQIFPEARGLDLLRKVVALEAVQGSTPDALLRLVANDKLTSPSWSFTSSSRSGTNRICAARPD